VESRGEGLGGCILEVSGRHTSRSTAAALEVSSSCKPTVLCCTHQASQKVDPVVRSPCTATAAIC
jgi:hypothetical protein